VKGAGLMSYKQRVLVRTLATVMVTASLAAAAPAAAEPDRPGVTQTQSTYRECEGETQYCTKNAWAKKKVKQFRRGKLGRAGRHVHYPRPLKRKIINGVIRASRLITKSERGKAWRAYTDNDNCIVTGEFGYLHECRKGISKLKRLSKSDVRVIKCSGKAYIAMFAGAIGGPPGIAAGGIAAGLDCAWEAVWEGRGR
jgi:hypothetical protein